jgi:hypothetical protein
MSLFNWYPLSIMRACSASPDNPLFARMEGWISRAKCFRTPFRRTSPAPINTSYSAPSMSTFMRSQRPTPTQERKSWRQNPWTFSVGRAYLVGRNRDDEPVFISGARQSRTSSVLPDITHLTSYTFEQVFSPILVWITPWRRD